MKKTLADNEMADRLNLTVKRVKQLEESGVLIRNPDGDFDIERNASRYGLYKEKDVGGVGREIERLTQNIDAGMKRLRAATPTQRIKLGIALGPLIGQLLAAFSLSTPATIRCSCSTSSATSNGARFVPATSTAQMTGTRF